MHKSKLFLVSILLFCSSVFGDSDLITIKSSHDVAATADRLEKALLAKGMTLFIRIDHAAGAHKVGQSLRPTELVIFGNPKIGTPMMQCSQTLAIDLPQKALIWEDEEGQVWLSYNDSQYVANRHGVSNCAEVVKKIGNALGNFAKAATMP